MHLKHLHMLAFVSVVQLFSGLRNSQARSLVGFLAILN
jgi:hypothetical protein